MRKRLSRLWKQIQYFFKTRVLSEDRRPLDQIVSSRIVIFAGLILAAFIVIFMRLFYIQVISYNSYTEKKNDYTSIIQYIAAPRGQIYDCKGRVLAKTVISHNIVYTSPRNMTVDDYRVYAERIVEVFNVDASTFTERDIKEAYMTYKSFLDYSDPEYAANHLLTKSELAQYSTGAWGSNAEAKRYQLIYSRITDKQLSEMDEKELKICVVYQRMVNYQTAGQENVILQDVSDDDVAYLVEHKTEFPGFDVDFGGWKREYPYGESLSDVLGSVSTSTEGLPDTYSDYYLAKGYQYNAPVGKSGLEFQYNDYLSGVSEKSRITYDSNGLARKEILRSAQKGYDIYLSIDIDLQTALDATIKSVLESAAGTSGRENFQSLFTCIMNPKNGELLALSGYSIDLETKQMTYFASGNYVSLANPGSCVKGVTVYMGLSEGVVKPGEIINDEVMNIGGEEFGSYENHGPVDDIEALAVSSNVYMFNIAIRMGGGQYVEGQALNFPDTSATLNRMRRYYSMFGLGNQTGVDLPNEVNGFLGVGFIPSMALNYAIGQLDMYSPLQLLQYIGTIAANGDMYQMHVMTEVKENGGSSVVDTGEVEIRSSLPKKNAEYLNRVQQGMRACVATGYCGNFDYQLDYEVAAKTGTAEVTKWTTATFVGFAPYENPTMAFACVAPTSSVNDVNVRDNICTYNVMPDVMATYFALYP